jgi:antitoxin CcdA
VPTNVSIRADLALRARARKLNLSQILEHALEQALRAEERAAWLVANEEAIDDYNAKVEKHGVFSDDWRRF